METPVLVYDDDCGFCTWWAEFFEDTADLRIVGYEDLTDDLRDRLPEDYEDCSHFVTDSAVYSCGASIEQAFVRSEIGRPLRSVVAQLNQHDSYTALREWGYKQVAHNRALAGKVMSSDTSE
ncbi:MAG: DCC1-like thiol-disulfide oxidoreductase family protein [Halovenus sp.]